MEPDNMIHRLQTDTSPETIKPGDKANPTFYYIPKMTSVQTGSLTVGAHSDTQSGWCYEKRQLYCFFFSLHLIWLKMPPNCRWHFVAHILSHCDHSHSKQKDEHIKEELSKFLSPAMFPSAFFFNAHFKSITSERVDRNVRIQKKMILFFCFLTCWWVFCVFYVKQT